MKLNHRYFSNPALAEAFEIAKIEEQNKLNRQRAAENAARSKSRSNSHTERAAQNKESQEDIDRKRGYRVVRAAEQPTDNTYVWEEEVIETAPETPEEEAEAVQFVEEVLENSEVPVEPPPENARLGDWFDNLCRKVLTERHYEHAIETEIAEWDRAFYEELDGENSRVRLMVIRVRYTYRILKNLGVFLALRWLGWVVSIIVWAFTL